MQDFEERFCISNSRSFSGSYVYRIQRRFVSFQIYKPENYKTMNRKIVECLRKGIWPFTNYGLSQEIKSYIANAQTTIATQFKNKHYCNKINSVFIYAKKLPFVLVAIDNIKLNKGSSIPGVDGKTLKTTEAAVEYVNLIDYKYLQKYQASKIRRIYILSKSSGEQRLLGIPTISDRIVQELFRLILDPVIDPNSDPNSYGFRKGRNSAMALGALTTFMRRALNKKTVLDLEITSFFNNLNKE